MSEFTEQRSQTSTIVQPGDPLHPVLSRKLKDNYLIPAQFCENALQLKTKH